MEPATRKVESKASVTLTYREKKKAQVTSLTPILTISVYTPQLGLNYEEEHIHNKVDIEIRIQGTRGSSVGKVGPNEFLDPDTGFLRIRPGTTTTVPLRLEEDFQGPCTVAAVDPATGKQYDRIELDVDILD